MMVMSSLARWYGQTANAEAGVDDPNPYAMPIVVRQSPDATHEDTLLAVARGVVLILSDSRWDEQVKQWNSSLYRKVVRRAKSSKWDSITQSLEGVTASHRDSAAFVMPPMPVSDTPREVSRLQVSGLDLPKSQSAENAPLEGLTLAVSMNPALDITTGKACAQIGHAAHLAILHSPPEVVVEWENSGLHMVLGTWQDDAELIVQDSGLTEIPPGSVTAQAAWLE